MKKRTIRLAQLKPECLAEYRKYHENVWPELVAAYRRAGIERISCFLHDTRLLVFFEYESEIYPESCEWLDKNEFEMKWAGFMQALADPSFKTIEFEEVYHMPSERSDP